MRRDTIVIHRNGYPFIYFLPTRCFAPRYHGSNLREGTSRTCTPPSQLTTPVAHRTLYIPYPGRNDTPRLLPITSLLHVSTRHRGRMFRRLCMRGHGMGSARCPQGFRRTGHTRALLQLLVPLGAEDSINRSHNGIPPRWPAPPRSPRRPTAPRLPPPIDGRGIWGVTFCSSTWGM